MPFNRPLLTDLINRVRNDVVSRLTNPDLLRRTNAEAYTKALSGAVHGLYGNLDWLANQLIYDTAETTLLDTWRRANADDELPASKKYGWWGDCYAQIPNDQIGSRLWLLSRSKLTTETVNRAQEYATEALQWLIDDGVADSVQISAETEGLSMLALQIRITRGNASLLNIRFIDVWDYLNAF